MSKPLLLSMCTSSAVCYSRKDFTQHSVCVSKGFYLFNHVTKTDSMPLCPLNITNGRALPLLYCVASIQHVLVSPNPCLPDEKPATYITPPSAQALSAGSLRQSNSA